jgi:hypothetical protein
MIIDIALFFSVLAIIGGGVISAFTARRPSRLTAWLSAYLVLVVGTVQLGLIVGWRELGSPHYDSMAGALIIYAVGNTAVVAGTLLKGKSKRSLPIVIGGSALLGIAMVELLYTTRGEPLSWIFVGFILLTGSILISMPIGVVQSVKRHKTLRNER